MSTLKVNTLKRYTGTTITIGESGDTITITSGATLSGSGASLTALDAGNISAGTLAIARGGTGSTSTTYASLTANVSGTLPVGNGGTNLTSYAVGDILYASGTTTLSKLAKPGTPADEVLTFATGGSAPSWVESAGGISWQSVQTSTVTAVAGKGYPVNTTAGEITVNLPVGVAGEQVGIVDYAGTFDTNACTVAPNGSEKFNGVAVDQTMNIKRQGSILTYIDSTQGWVVTQTASDPRPTISAVVNNVTDGTYVEVGDSIKITGANFGSSGATVKMNSTSCSSIAHTGTTHIICTVPSLSNATYDVEVTNTEGRSATATNAITVSSDPSWAGNTGDTTVSYTQGTEVTNGAGTEGTSTYQAEQYAATGDTTISYTLVGADVEGGGALNGLIEIDSSTGYLTTVSGQVLPTVTNTTAYTNVTVRATEATELQTADLSLTLTVLANFFGFGGDN